MPRKRNVTHQGEFAPDGRPIVEVRRCRQRRQVRFRCPYCQRSHFHGAVGLEEGELLGVSSHCGDPDSPYKGSYYVKVVPRKKRRL